MPGPIPECCLCEGCPQFADWIQLASHICDKHSGHRLTQFNGAYLLVSTSGWMNCWCGTFLEGDSEAQMIALLADHLQDEGGLEAHLLKLSFLYQTE